MHLPRSSIASPRSSLALPLAALALIGLTGLGCGPKPPARSPQERVSDAAPAVTALREARFVEAAKLAETALARDRQNGTAAAVHAIAGIQAAGSQLRDDLERLFDNPSLRALDHEQGRAMWQRYADALQKIDADLAVTAADANFSLELCVACWEHDWNRNGQIDDRDRRMFEIEYDGRAPKESAAKKEPPPPPDGELDGDPDWSMPDPTFIPEGDPRRRPTFRFDRGDADWARAMLSFQRAVMELILAYRWSELDKLFFGRGDAPVKMVIALQDGARVKRARELILAGLRHAERCRAAYLAETDDDREWMPNPSQKSYPIPLDVDAALYQTWSDVLGDLRRMLESEEGLSLHGLSALGDDADSMKYLPDAYVDLGALLREPSDIVIDFSHVDAIERNEDRPAEVQKVVEQMLRGILGKGYAPKMKPTPMLERLGRMKRELLTGEDTFERKLRYLFWLN